MHSDQFVTYRKFNDINEAYELGTLLAKNNLEYLHVDSSVAFDATFVNNELNKEYRVKIRKEDFEKADMLLLEQASEAIEDLDEDYYLFEFSDEELIDVVINRNDWSPVDFLLAQKLLKERGKEIRPELIQQLEKQKIEKLSEPEASQKAWIIVGYAFSILGGLLGIFIGWYLNTHKKTLPNGEQVFAYSEADRKQGKYILIIGIAFFVLWTLIKILTA